MVPIIPPGYQARLIGIAGSPGELNNFVPLEAGLPEPTRVLMRVDISVGEDVYTIAENLSSQLLERGIHPWPGYPGRVAFVEGNSVYLAWIKSFAWMPVIIGLLFGLPIILPIILWFVSPGFREAIMSMIGFMVMAVMALFVVKFSREMVTPAKPKEELAPFAERMEARLAAIGESIGTLETRAEAIPESLSHLESIIGETKRMVKEAPGIVQTSAEKERVTRQAAELERKLREYEESLPPELREKLEEERKLVKEIQELG